MATKKQNKKIITQNITFESLALHESTDVGGEDWNVLRVTNGWIYRRMLKGPSGKIQYGHPVFVPECLAVFNQPV